MIDLVAATVLFSLAPAPAASPLPAAALWTDDGTILEVPLAHRDRDRIDAGILRVDRRRRVLTWEGLPEEIGCGLRVEAPLDDVRGIAESREVGLTLQLRSGPLRELVLIPPAHFALLAQPTVRKRGGLSREEAIAGRLRTTISTPTRRAPAPLAVPPASWSSFRRRSAATCARWWRSSAPRRESSARPKGRRHAPRERGARSPALRSGAGRDDGAASSSARTRWPWPRTSFPRAPGGASGP